MPFNPEKKKAYDAAYRLSHKKETVQYQKEYYEKCPEKLKKKSRDRSRKIRNEVVEAYGSTCVCCGETEEMFLTIDHIENDGAADRRRLTGSRTGGGTRLYRELKRLGYPKDRYRLLCFNCNCGRARNGGTCPHKEGSP